MREMPLYYGLGRWRCGGSFAPLGGQNLIEAAACGCPVVMGPHTFNFAEAAELAAPPGGASRVETSPAGLDAALALLADAQALAPGERAPSRPSIAVRRGAMAERSMGSGLRYNTRLQRTERENRHARHPSSSTA